MIRVRPAAPPDAPAVARIYVDSWNLGFAGLAEGIALDAPRIEQWAVTLAAGPSHRWWIAERDGAAVGFAGIGPSRDPRDPALGELDTIAVVPACWRSGVGRALMAEALRGLRAAGYPRAVLWTFARYPHGAAFYEATGWERTETIRDGGRQVLYARVLTPGS